MPREADDDNSVISQLKCEISTLVGEEAGECQNSGEVRYRGALLCEAHATLLKLQDRAEAVLDIVCSGWTSGWKRERARLRTRSLWGAYSTSETKL